ncbi:MAG: methyltransferase domain-containing protein [Akkermansia sp.]|nr:methyltransferase domain-containing protein [Akkermansia sp.]
MTTSSQKPLSPRAAALRCLMRWDKGGIFAETLIARESVGMSSADRALLQSIVLGVLRNLRWLCHIRKQLRSAQLEDKGHWLVIIGLCELLVLNHAEYAVVSENVSLAPSRLRGVVNAMLRNALRRREEILGERKMLSLGMRYSTPDWLVKRWIRDFGKEDTAALLAWNVQPPPVYARLNPLRPMDSPLADAEPLADLPGWYRLRAGVPLAALKAGQVYVADPSTRHCVRLLAPQPGERVLDACAAPGGKSAAIIAATMGQVHLCATDAEQHRLPSLLENLQRAGGENVSVELHDWTQPCPEKWQGAFDAVLLDVPCSNSGVLQRRVDARWRLQEKEIARLAGLQALILEQAAVAVRPGGRLVYSTCSIDNQEDREVVDAFLAEHPEFSLVADYLALPHKEQADGAYAALLQRIAD